MTARTVLLLSAVAVLLGGALTASAGEIHQAVHAGDVARVAALLGANPALVDEPEDFGFASLPLHIAASDGNVEIARLLLAAGADVDGFDSDESTPLHVAAMNRHAEMVSYLLLRGADVNRRDRNGACALSFAASSADSAVVQLVLDAGADLNVRNRDGVTLLHLAVARGLDRLLDRLIEHAADLRATTEGGDTALHWAANGTRVDLVERLLAAGLDPDVAAEHGWTPLMNAARAGRLEIVRRLIDAGADVNAVSEGRQTPLLVCGWEGHADVARLLIEHGAILDQADEQGQTTLTDAANGGHAELARVLLEAGASPDPVDVHFGQTPLHRAAVTGRAEIAELLIAHGASLALEDASGQTALELANRYAHADVARVLVDGGAVGAVDAGVPAGSLAAQPALGDGEAVLWYLGHSGYAVETRNHLLVFDYRDQGTEPVAPGLVNGHIVPAEIAGKAVTVFASHEHRDHYDPVVFEWREQVPDIRYVIGFEPVDVPSYTFIPPHESRTLDGMRITTIESNDSGVGFMVEVDGLVLFHAGDHANRWQDFSGPYTTEIDWLAEAGFRPDIALLPSTGCQFRDQVAVKMGIRYALKALAPNVFIPVHGGGGTWRYREVIDACQESCPDVRMVAPVDRGDRFRYSERTIDLRMSQR